MRFHPALTGISSFLFKRQAKIALDGGLDLLASASGGNPRLLNLLARAAWLAAAASGVNTIGPDQVQKSLQLVPAVRDKINP
jgi:type II secretory pathway predicted ATPase ExeA